MPRTLDLQHFRGRLQIRLDELQRMENPDENRGLAVELDQSKVGRISRIDALQQQAMLDAARGSRSARAGAHSGSP